MDLAPSISDQQDLVGQAVNRAIMLGNKEANPSSPSAAVLDTSKLADPARWTDPDGFKTPDGNLLSNLWDALVFRLHSDIGVAAAVSTEPYKEADGTISYRFQKLTGHGYVFLEKW